MTMMRLGVDAHELRGVGVLCGGLHGAAGAAAAYEEGEGGHAEDGGQDEEDVGVLDGDGADVVGGVEAGEGAGAVGAGVEVADDLLERQGEADGGDERCQSWCSAQWPVGEPFRSDGDEDGHEGAAEKHQRHGEGHRGAVGEYVEVDREGAERSGHEDLAVREVDELDDAVHHRVADGYQPVHRAEKQPVGQLLRQGVHRVASMSLVVVCTGCVRGRVLCGGVKTGRAVGVLLPRGPWCG